MNKFIMMGVIFTNDEGKYYLEEVSFYPLEKIKRDWKVEKVIDGTNKLGTYGDIKEELNSPTISDGSQLVILDLGFKDKFYDWEFKK